MQTRLKLFGSRDGIASLQDNLDVWLQSKGDAIKVVDTQQSMLALNVFDRNGNVVRQDPFIMMTIEYEVP